MNYGKHVSTKKTVQTEPVPGMAQVKNSAGGFVFAADKWTRFKRFLILGSEGGSYYASEKKLTQENAASVVECIKEDGGKAINLIIDVSSGGKAPKNDPAIFALALALKEGDVETRRLASASIPQVCRIGTHLFQMAEAVKELGGWGRVTKRGFTRWYENQQPDSLALNLVKYQSRNGWSHRDILRKAKPKPKSEVQKLSYQWAVGKLPAEQSAQPLVPALIRGFEMAKVVTKDTEMVQLITDYNLPRECVPTQMLNSVKVWDALLTSGNGMPLTAMVRNLGKMTEIGLIKPLSDASHFVAARLGDKEALRKARIHPMALLMAQSTYSSGHGLKGSLSWNPDSNVVDALDEAFYMAFDTIVPTGKRYLLALDVSGSMSGGSVAGSNLTPRDASAAMSLVTARTEPWHHIVGFGVGGSSGLWGSGTQLKPLKLSPKMKLPEAVRSISDIPFGTTDCSLPMQYALKEKLKVDVFVIYTDSETYAGVVHPFQALRQYRQETGIDAKLIVCGMVSNGFTIADPNDAGMLDVVGFSTDVPTVMNSFVTG